MMYFVFIYLMMNFVEDKKSCQVTQICHPMVSYNFTFQINIYENYHPFISETDFEHILKKCFMKKYLIINITNLSHTNITNKKEYKKYFTNTFQKYFTITLVNCVRSFDLMKNFVEDKI